MNSVSIFDNKKVLAENMVARDENRDAGPWFLLLKVTVPLLISLNIYQFNFVFLESLLMILSQNSLAFKIIFQPDTKLYNAIKIYFEVDNI